MSVATSRNVEAEHPKERRTALVVSIVVGVLAAGGTLAGNLVNIVSGSAALALAVSGAVLAGTAAITTLLVTGPVSPAQSPPRTPRVSTGKMPSNTVRSARLNPLSVIRSMRLGLACVFLALAPFFGLEILEPDPDDKIPDSAENVSESSMAFLFAIGGCAVSVWLNFVRSSSGGSRQRGSGFDAVLSYTTAAGLGITQASASLGHGLAMAGLVLILTTMVGGAFEEDLYRGKGIPVILVALGAGSGIGAAYLSNVAAAWVPLIGLIVAVCLPLPAILRGGSDLAPGVLEFAPCLVAIILAVTVNGVWAATAAIVFLMATTYSWMFPQPSRPFGDEFTKRYDLLIFLLKFGAGAAVFAFFLPVVMVLVDSAGNWLESLIQD